MSEYLEIKNLQIGFRTYEGDKQVLNIEHIAIDRGETYGLVGESGAGKTVLALTILNLLPAASMERICSPKLKRKCASYTGGNAYR